MWYYIMVEELCSLSSAYICSSYTFSCHVDLYGAAGDAFVDVGKLVGAVGDGARIPFVLLAM